MKVCQSIGWTRRREKKRSTRQGYGAKDSISTIDHHIKYSLDIRLVFRNRLDSERLDHLFLIPMRLDFRSKSLVTKYRKPVCPCFSPTSKTTTKQ